MKGQYVIIDLRNMDFMKNEEGKISYYNTEEEASLVCGMYEFENALLMKCLLIQCVFLQSVRICCSYGKNGQNQIHCLSTKLYL